MSKKFKPDKTSLVSFSLMGPESGAFSKVDCSDGQITRITPYEYDTSYTEAKCRPWKIEARGKVFRPPTHIPLTHFGLG